MPIVRLDRNNQGRFTFKVYGKTHVIHSYNDKAGLVLSSSVHSSVNVEVEQTQYSDREYRCVVNGVACVSSVEVCEVSNIGSRLQNAFNRIVTESFGVHIVAEWADGGSDAVDLPIYTKQAFKSKFPQANEMDIDAFFRGERDGFVVREWTDEHNRSVTDRVYFCRDYEAKNESVILTAEDERHALHVEISTQSIF